LKRLQIDPNKSRPADLQAAAEWLRAGRVVIYPTDTVYGMAADPSSSAAVADLFALKGRAADVAMPLIAASMEQVESCCGTLPKTARELAQHFWPGPLSLIVNAPAQIAAEVHGGAGTIAIRVPANIVARTVCETWGGVLTATSANRSGEPPARTVQDIGDLAEDPRVLVIDAGPSPGGLPSTIVDARGPTPRLVRAGAIAWDRVLESIQE
jgi:L-threonylcarbamoyladenylate synthase